MSGPHLFQLNVSDKIEPCRYSARFLFFDVEVCIVNTQHFLLKWCICCWRPVTVFKTLGWSNSMHLLYTVNERWVYFPPLAHSWITLLVDINMVMPLYTNCIECQRHFLSSLNRFLSPSWNKSSYNVLHSPYRLLHNWFKFNKGTHWRIMAFIHLSSARQKRLKLLTVD